MVYLGALKICRGDFRKQCRIRQFALWTRPYGCVPFVGIGNPRVILPSCPAVPREIMICREFVYECFVHIPEGRVIKSRVGYGVPQLGCGAKVRLRYHEDTGHVTLEVLEPDEETWDRLCTVTYLLR